MASTPIYGITLPDSTSAPANLPAQVMTAFTAAEKLFVGSFASTSARDAKITTPVAGMLVWIVAGPYFMYYDGTIWRPPPGTVIATYNAALTSAGGCVVTNPGDSAGFVNPGVNVPSYTFPTSHDIRYGCFFTCSTPTDLVDITLLVNLGGVRKHRAAASFGYGHGTFIQATPAGTSNGYIAALIKAFGTTSATAGTDPVYNYMTITVTAV